ncbi:MAG: phosphoribosylamine--glycine ligase, partial [Planctomycetes bacterium]|nr:phosphoribosylamine--glycine ligase [Planctomycetota bacterium]
VLEERLPGAEASVHAICDGERVLMLPAAQDHKRALEGDQGPNTGRMGTYAPAPLVDAALLDRVRDEVVLKVIRGMQAEGTPFVGTLFVGLMVSPEGEPRVLEFNVRFGDPEMQAIARRFKSDLLPYLVATAKGKLAKMDPPAWDERFVVGVVAASEGYPGTYRRGDRITGIDAAESLDDVVVFHAGTSSEGDEAITSGGRVLCVTGMG